MAGKTFDVAEVLRKCCGWSFTKPRSEFKTRHKILQKTPPQFHPLLLAKNLLRG